MRVFDWLFHRKQSAESKEAQARRLRAMARQEVLGPNTRTVINSRDVGAAFSLYLANAQKSTPAGAGD